MAGQQPGQGGFGQVFGQPSYQPFGQQPAANPAPFSFGAAPSAAPAPATTPPPGFGFGFGQSPAQAPSQQQHQQPAGFGFGQPQAPAFGHQAAPPPAFGGAPVFSNTSTAGSGGFNFNAAAPAFTPTAAPAPRSFDFGSALRKQEHAAAAPSPAPIAFGSQAPGRQQQHQQQQQNAVEEEEEEEFDYEAAKRAALDAMPSFQGTGGGSSAAAPPKSIQKKTSFGGGGFTRPPPPPATRKKQSAQAAAAAQQGEDPAEVARRMQRANRFAPVSATPSSISPPQASPQMFTVPPVTSSRPPPGLIRPASSNFGGDEGSNINDEDDYGGVGGGRGPIVGTCEDMCPASERERRQNMSDIQIFERVDPNNPNLTSAELAVRRFARTVDDPHPSEFRTRGALTRTMDYLRRLLDRTDVRFGLVHKFLWDRYRSIRQDLYIQNISDEFAINIFEEIVRFHVLCEHELCGEDQSVTDMEGFNSHLNMEQMNKALISLNEMYNKAAAKGRPSPNEAEFRTYHLLSLMAQHGKFKGDQQAFLSTLQALRPEVRGSAMVQWALKLRANFVAGNFVGFFLLVQEAAYLPACAAHTYFPAVRARFLRTLAETLAPTASRPAIVEISWLRRALMMDSDEEVISVAAIHGFTEVTTDAETGEPALLLGKGQYVDPPPPLIKRSAEWIRAKAPGLRSVCVATTAGKPLSPEETAALREQQRKAEQARHEAAAAARAAAQAEEMRRQQAAAAAAEEQQRQQQAVYEAQQRKFEEEQRAQQVQAEVQRRAEEEVQMQRQLAAAAEARRLAEEEAERERKVAAERAAIEAAQRAAAEAEARRLEAERTRRATEEAERRRREEEERRRAKELQQKAAALRVRVFERKYFGRWVAQMRRLVAERRRNERIAASLKACRVGIIPGMAEEIAAAGAALGDLDIDGDADRLEKKERKSAFTKTSGGRGALDLASLVAPLLAQNNPGVQSLFWKAAVLGSSSSSSIGGGGGDRSIGTGTTTLTSDSLLKWLQLQLSCGKVTSSSSGSVYVDGPVEVELRRGYDALGTAVLKTCTSIVSPANSLSRVSSDGSTSLYKSSLAGASGVIIAASGDEAAAGLSARNLVAALPAAAPAVPVLIVAAGEQQAQLWLHTWLETLGSRLHNAKVHAIIVSTSENGLIYSKTQLAQGLRWLAARAPPQPVLAVVRLEDATRDALAATTTTSPIGKYSSSFYSLKTAVDLVTAAVKEAGASLEAAWQWPPPELAEGGLRHWYTTKTQDTLLSALENISAADSTTTEANAVAMHLRVSELSAVQQPLVLPATAHTNFCTALRTATEQQEGREQKIQQQQQPPLQDQLLQLRSSNLSRQQKRKWRHSPDGEAERPSGAAAHARIRQNLVSLEQNIALERSIERQFDAELAEAAGDFGVIKSNGGGGAEDVEYKQEDNDEYNVAVVFPTSQSKALQELNAALQQERKASHSLWRRMKTMATSLF
ncbi:putative SAC3 family protein B [Nannochloris sp. 'desiccata']|nr:putative SAC3 family protein B [Chlorella desiccata (nom. nud.)]